MICKHILLIMFLNEPKLFFCTQLNASKYCYVSLTIHVNISYLFAHSLNVKLFYLTTLGLSEPRSNGNKGVLHILQISKA